MRIPEYPVATAPDTTDHLLIDGTAGTRIIAVDDFFNNGPKADIPVYHGTAEAANWNSDGVGYVCWIVCPDIGVRPGAIIQWDLAQTATDDQAAQFLEAGIRLVNMEIDRIRVKAENLRPNLNIPIDICNLFP